MEIKAHFLIISFVLSSQLFATGYEGKYLFERKKPKNSIYQMPDEKQNLKNRFLISFNIGYNEWGSYINYDYYDSRDKFLFDISKKTSPFYNLAVDYGFHKRFSAGISFGFQKNQISFFEKYYYSPTYYEINSYNYQCSRYSIFLRADYYIVSKEKFFMYTGFRLGNSILIYKDDVISNYQAQYEKKNNLQTLNIHYGCSYYFNKQIGLNAEIGLGSWVPYIAAIGITVKI